MSQPGQMLLREEQKFHITKQMQLIRFEVSPNGKDLILHYSILVDVLNANLDIVASQCIPRTAKLTFNGINSNSDIEEIADRVYGEYDFLAESKRPLLLKALSELKAFDRPASLNTNEKPPNPPNPKLPSTAPTSIRDQTQKTGQLSRSDLDQLIFDVIQVLHLGPNEEVVKVLTKLSEAAQNDRNLLVMLQNQSLLNTLSSSLKQYSKSSILICIQLLSIIEKISLFTNFHQVIARFKLGALTLSLLFVQIQLSSLAEKSMSPADYAQYTNQQNGLLKIAISILNNLSDDPGTLRKMFNNGIIDPLIYLLPRRDVDLKTTAIRFIRKISEQKINWGGVPYDEIIPLINTDILKTDLKMNAYKKTQLITDTLELLVVFGEHHETHQLMAKEDIFEAINELADNEALTKPILKLLYVTSNGALCNKGKLVDLLIRVMLSESEDSEFAVSILTNLVGSNEVLSIVVQSPHFTMQNIQDMFAKATKTRDAGKLRLLKAVGESRHSLVSGFDDLIVETIMKEKNSPELLCEVFGIAARSKMDASKAKFYVSIKEVMEITKECLDNGAGYPQLQLEVVQFVGALVLFSAAAKTLDTLGITGSIVKVFMRYTEDLDIQNQCLFVFYRFMCHSTTRTSLLKHRNIIDRVIELSASQNEITSEIGGSVLEALLIFDAEWEDKIKNPRFEAYNSDWIKSTKK